MATFEPRSLIAGAHALMVRAAEEQDAAGLLNLMRLTADETDFLLRSSDEIRITQEQEREFLRAQAASQEDLFLVATVQSRVVGCLSLTGSGLRRLAHAATLGMAVAREFWGEGIGSALLRAALDWADARGLSRVSLEVVETNERAIGMYRHFGFVEEGRLRSNRRHGEQFLDTLAMSRVRS